MLSIVVTTKDKETTFQKSFSALLAAVVYWQKVYSEEHIQIVIISPITYQFLNTYTSNLSLHLTLITDQGRSKSAALNQAMSYIQGEYTLLTDGDVILDEKAIANLYVYFKENDLVIAGGKPVSINDRNTMLGYWSCVLVEGNAHRLRESTEKKRLQKKHVFFAASGYLFMLKTELFPKLREDLLSEDAYISYSLFSQGYSIGYCDKALVYVKFPTTYHDYIKQKTRSIGGNRQDTMSESNYRSFRYEAINGLIASFTYAKTFKEILWTFLLFIARIHVWLNIHFVLRVKKNTDIWEEISTSKDI